jgi:DNA-binding transcriptional MerR regulator
VIGAGDDTETEVVHPPLTLPQLAEAASIEYGTLHSWIKRGLLAPSLQASTGTGRPNLFSRRDLLTVKVMADLRAAGVGFESLELTATALQRPGQELEGNEVLVINGSVELIDGDRSLSQALKRREPAVVYPLAWASEAVEEFLSTSG